MKKPNETLIAIASIGELVTKTLDTSKILNQVVAITANIMKVDACSIYLYHREEDTLILEATVGLKQESVGQVKINLGEGITGRAAKQGRLVAVEDVESDKRNIYIPITGEEEYRAILSAPLMFREELVGVINLQTKKTRVFEKNERRLLKTIAHQVSGSLRNSLLYESVLSTNKELKETQALLVQSEKMAALGRLSATLSHELRNPLAGLKGASQLLLRKTPDHDDRRQYVNVMLDEVERLGRIVEELLHFARPRELLYEQFSATKCIEDVLLLNSEDLSVRNISVRKRLSKLPAITADSDKFKQVIMNIIINARDSMPDGGQLIISTGVLKSDTEGKQIVTLQFRDSGSGIPKEVIDQVFEPFYTTKPSGVGLGLSVCKSIIDEHGGKISIESDSSAKSRSGTVVTIEIPVHNPQNALTN